MSEVLCRGRVVARGYVCIAFLLSAASAHGQKYEITPLIGGAFGGTIKLEQASTSNVEAHVSDSFTFGVAGGYRFDSEDEGYDAIEFRWMRQNTNLGFKETTPVPTPLAAAFGRTAVTLDHYLADFTYEWNLDEAKPVRPFVLGSLGAARLSTPVTGSTRFAFGLGAGVKIFPQRHWGVRLQVEYLPMLMHSEVQRVVCAGGCVVALGGGLMNQFEFTFGPVFRF